MRDYEIVYIFRPELESDAVDAKLEDYHGRLGGEVTAVEHWGTRQLAFEIAGERSGYYVVAQYRADPASLEGFEQGLKHDEELIRHLVVLAEGELPAPPSDRPSSDEAEDEDEEEGDGEGASDEPEDEGDEEDDGGEEEDEEDTEDEDEDEEDTEDAEDAEDADDEEEADDDGDSDDEEE